MPQQFDDVVIGIALGGGAARGFAHIGVLQALKESNINPSVIAGTSSGAIVAALYGFNVPLDEILDLAKSVNWHKLTDFKPSKMGLLSNGKIGEILEERLGPVNIEDASKKIAIIATDLEKKEKAELTSGRLSQAVLASTAIPGIFKPVEVGGRLLADGLMTENLPVSLLKKMGARLTIGVPLGANKPGELPENIFDVISSSFDIAISSHIRNLMKQVDVLIVPDVEKFGRIEIKKAQEIYDEGYKAAKIMVPALYDALKNIPDDKKPLTDKIKSVFRV